MRTLDLRLEDDALVLHLHKEQRGLNAYTLASALVSLADAAKEANHLVNPGFEIQVVVEALRDGSFKVRIRAVYSTLKNLFSKENVKPVILALIAAFIYEHTFSSRQAQDAVSIQVTSDEVVVQQGDQRVVVPRVVYEEMKRVEVSSPFREKIGEAFESIRKDDDVVGVSVEPCTEQEEEPVLLERIDFEQLAAPPQDPRDHRFIEEVADLGIVRAILEPSRRLWEFSWRGFRISAPVIDKEFFEKFRAHRFTIAPGDFLRAKLRVYQRLNPVAGVYMNESYAVVEVLSVEPGQTAGKPDLATWE